MFNFYYYSLKTLLIFIRKKLRDDKKRHFKSQFIQKEIKSFIKKQPWEKWSLNLGMHAAEDEGRTEEATETKRKKAREQEGKVFLTQELPQAFVLLIGFIFFYLLGAYYFRLLKETFVKYLQNVGNIKINHLDIQWIIFDIAETMILFILPVGAVVVLIAVFMTMVQTNFHFSLVPLQFKLSKITLSFDNFVKRTVFSRIQLFNSIKIFIKIIVIAVVSYFFLYFYFTDMAELIYASLQASFNYISNIIFQMMMVISFIFLLLSIPDWFIQKRDYEEQLKMTKQEVKQELKESEGDPHVKLRIRERAREISKKEIVQNVKNADLVVRNPTHFACAISYKPAEMDAPKLVAKGMDSLALRIIEIAEKENVAVVENKPLARALYTKVEENSYIPYEFFSAIAGLLGALDKFKQK